MTSVFRILPPEISLDIVETWLYDASSLLYSMIVEIAIIPSIRWFELSMHQSYIVTITVAANVALVTVIVAARWLASSPHGVEDVAPGGGEGVQ